MKLPSRRCVGVVVLESFESEHMLRTNPTRIGLQNEDMREYEERKKTWPKLSSHKFENNNQTIPESISIDGNRLVRNTRIGLPQK